ncbi:phospholipase A1-II 1 [Capsicum chacoense]
MACMNKGWEILIGKIKSFLKRKKGIENRDNSIAERWEILSGKTNWEDLLDPLDYDLRLYLIHYGQMCQAIYDSFNNEEASKYRGTSRYSKKNLFTRVGLDKNNPYKYEIAKYVYAASDVPSETEKVKESNWIGYVGVATDEGKVALGRRDILIAWRGTVMVSEWNDDFENSLVQPTEIFGENTNNILVHKGFYSIYTSLNEASDFNRTTSARDQVLEEVKRLLDQYKEEEVSITVTGHSLGSSLSTLCAIDIVVNQINKEFPVTAFVFACPRVGEKNFKKAYGKLKTLQILRISNTSDPVPKLPERGVVDGSENDWRVYEDVGFELLMETTKSKYLKKCINSHILEVYLHGIAGTHGPEEEFKLEINRDIALMNKAADVLKDEYGVPVSWWIEKNKGMVQQEDGSWILMDHENGDTYFLP